FVSGGLRGLTGGARGAESERAAFESAVRAEGLGDYGIEEPGPDGALKPAAHRSVYFPLRYSAPAGTRSPLGLDVLSDMARAETLRRALSTGRIAAAPQAPFRSGGSGTLIFLPVYASTMTPTHLTVPLAILRLRFSISPPI